MRVLRENTLGLVIDYQERLLPHIYENQQLLANTLVLIEGLKALEIPLIVTEQYRKGLGITVPEIKNLFSPFDPMEKVSFSCYDDQGIGKALAATGQKSVVICGIEAHVCVLQTAIDLMENNYMPVVVADCISSRKPDDKQTAIKRMRQEGIIITSCEAILFELCRAAGTDQFKAISKLVK
ncbi:MAG: hydrolase [Deltaproteobacteria bacterium]|nr:hydrolase [Deltaproteobacteria bacterium]